MLGMDVSLIQERNRGIMGVEEEEDEVGSFSSFGDDDGSTNSTGSSSLTSDFMEDAASSTASWPPEGGHDQEEGPLFEMSALIAQLPVKRGLSRYFEGKSQSFTSLSSVMSLEDLAKPERMPPSQKRLKTCKSYAGGLADGHKALSPKGSSRKITKKASRGSLSALGTAKRRQGFQLGNKPPIPPQRSASQTFLFA